MENWPFLDPMNTAAFTLRHIAFNGAVVCHVFHDAEDGAWQFLCWETPAPEDIVIIGLGEIVAMDSSLAELADLPLGWEAYRRTKDDPWHRARTPATWPGA